MPYYFHFLVQKNDENCQEIVIFSSLVYKKPIKSLYFHDKTYIFHLLNLLATRL